METERFVVRYMCIQDSITREIAVLCTSGYFKNPQYRIKEIRQKYGVDNNPNTKTYMVIFLPDDEDKKNIVVWVTFIICEDYYSYSIVKVQIMDNQNKTIEYVDVEVNYTAEDIQISCRTIKKESI